MSTCGILLAGYECIYPCMNWYGNEIIEFGTGVNAKVAGEARAWKGQLACR